MKLETIKKDKKKKIVIGSMIVLSVVGCLTLTTTRAKYRNVQSLKLASGMVNYKTSDLHIVAVKVSEDGTNYTDQTNIPESGYTFNTEKSKCRIPTTTLTGENAPADENIPIEYKEGRVYIGINRKNTKCYLYFDKEKDFAADTLAKLNVTSYKTTVPSFVNVATANEGVYRTKDYMYGSSAYTYYWRGAVIDNYVKFANKCWRIVRINGDGSIRLIYDGATCHTNGTSTTDSLAVVTGSTTVYKFNSLSNNSSYVGWTYTAGSQRPQSSAGSVESSNAKIQLETWYKSNLASYEEKIVNGKFCNDRNTKDNKEWVATSPISFAISERLSNGTKTPTTDCDSNDIYTTKIGLITADEASFAGAVLGSAANKNYYLYNGQTYWSMSPYYWSGSYADMLCVSGNGYLNSNTISFAVGLRPVINLRSDVIFNAGSDGTQNNPYIVQ